MRHIEIGLVDRNDGLFYPSLLHRVLARVKVSTDIGKPIKVEFAEQRCNALT